MSDATYARRMARYNQWQNQSLLTATNALSVDDRRKDMGAFFGSVEATFAHLLWGDSLWMARFAPERFEVTELNQRPERNATVDWDAFVSDRAAFDARIVEWAKGITDAYFDDPLTWYSGIQKATVSRPRAFLVTHMFNHQTHHRGQIHAMLTALGGVPEDTDLMLMDPSNEERPLG